MLISAWARPLYLSYDTGEKTNNRELNFKDKCISISFYILKDWLVYNILPFFLSFVSPSNHPVPPLIPFFLHF